MDAALRTAPAAPAAEVYTGVLYDHLRLPELPAKARRRVLIASALWGVVRPEDRIPYYRFSAKARLARIGPPSAWWRDALAAAMPDEPGDLVVDMRSAAYAAAWKPKRATLLAVRAFSASGGKRKPVSHMAKAVRGDVARALLLAKKAPRDPEAAAAIAARRLRGRALRLQPRRHRPARLSAGQVAGGGRGQRRQGLDLDLAERGDRLAVGALDLARLLRPGSEDDRGDLEAGGAGGLDRQQRVVDRAEARGGGDHQRVAEIDREVADQIGGRLRRIATIAAGHQQAADALADQGIGARGRRGAGGLEQPRRLDLLARHRRRQVRRGGRPVPIRRDLLVALLRPRGKPQQLMIRQGVDGPQTSIWRTFEARRRVVRRGR